MSATLTEHALPQRLGDFATLAEALDYAARGQTGMNFYDGRCQLTAVLEYATLRRNARMTARRLLGLGLARGERVALIAESDPCFAEVFFACQYAGLVPVPLPLPSGLGCHEAYVQKLRGLLQSCRPAAVVAPGELLGLVTEATRDGDFRFVGDGAALNQLPAPEQALRPSAPDEVAYLQYTSGSTRFPRGVVVTQQAVMANLQGMIRHGLAVRRGDRCASWLPFYHDMGLVGFVLGPMASQLSVDYLRTRDFAMRPRQWLALISQNRATIAFAPPFGYDICARRVRASETDRFDLSAWRVAGIGAEPIRAEVLMRFAELLAPAGFDPRAFLPCYGLAEATLGVSFGEHGAGLRLDRVARDPLEHDSRALPVDDGTAAASAFVSCGRVLPGHALEIRDDHGRALGERQVGRITLCGPSLMRGYFEDDSATCATLDAAGQWLDTGDLGYLAGGELFITGRRKDLLIVRGRNIWPQDIEYLAECEPELRPGDAIAFLVPSDEEPQVVLQVQCRLTDGAQRAQLVARLTQVINSECGVAPEVRLVPPHSLPRTSSGKPSRAEAQRRFLAAQQDDAGLSAVAG